MCGVYVLTLHALPLGMHGVSIYVMPCDVCMRSYSQGGCSVLQANVTHLLLALAVVMGTVSTLLVCYLYTYAEVYYNYCLCLCFVHLITYVSCSSVMCLYGCNVVPV